MDDKKTLRQLIKRLKSEHPMTASQRFELGNLVIATIETQCANFVNARQILIYHELPDELPLSQAAQRWTAMGKKIYLPRIKGDDLEVVPCEGTLKPDPRFGVEEPCGPAVDASAIDMVIVPAVALDRHGNRLGRGKGYYDKFLRSLTGATTVGVGVGYDFQLVEHVPVDAHDVPLQFIVTPSYHNFHV